MLKQAVQSLIIAAIRPYVYRELPGWGHVYKALVGDYRRNWLWKKTKPRVIWGKLHNYKMTLDISNWADRSTYFLGRWYDLGMQMTLAAAVCPGDTVVDIGANRGMFALVAARQVGASGVIHCFEPNPKSVAILHQDLDQNEIQNVIVHNFGLSNENRELTLTIPCINSGEATFGRSAYEETEEIIAPVRIGDQVLEDVIPDLIKVDVEGYETRAIEGLSKTIVRSLPLIITEVIEQHLQRAGTSADELFGVMEGFGYRGFQLLSDHSAIHLEPYTREDAKAAECDFAWLHTASKASERLRAAVKL